jgi:hypothetical protein
MEEHKFKTGDRVKWKGRNGERYTGVVQHRLCSGSYEIVIDGEERPGWCVYKYQCELQPITEEATSGNVQGG